MVKNKKELLPHCSGFLWTAVSEGSTFQDLPRLRETVDNTERNTQGGAEETHVFHIRITLFIFNIKKFELHKK